MGPGRTGGTTSSLGQILSGQNTKFIVGKKKSIHLKFINQKINEINKDSFELIVPNDWYNMQECHAVIYVVDSNDR